MQVMYVQEETVSCPHRLDNAVWNGVSSATWYQKQRTWLGGGGWGLVKAGRVGAQN